MKHFPPRYQFIPNHTASHNGEIYSPCLQDLKTHVHFISIYFPPTYSASDPDDSSLHLRRHDPESFWADSGWCITWRAHRFSRKLGATSKL